MKELDKCWKNCMSMWLWIAGEWKKGRRDVISLKKEWLDRYGYERNSIRNNCFFCQRATRKGIESCYQCPGVLVDSRFACGHSDYGWHLNPIKFYNKLRSLNRKRLIITRKEAK